MVMVARQQRNLLSRRRSLHKRRNMGSSQDCSLRSTRCHIQCCPPFSVTPLNAGILPRVRLALAQVGLQLTSRVLEALLHAAFRLHLSSDLLSVFHSRCLRRKRLDLLAALSQLRSLLHSYMAPVELLRGCWDS